MTTHTQPEIDRLAEQRELARVRLDRVLVESRRLADELVRIDLEIQRLHNENREGAQHGFAR